MKSNLKIEFNFFKPRKEKIKNYEASAPPEFSDFYLKKISNKKQTYCLGGRHMSYINIIIDYEKVNPRPKNLVKI